MNKRAPELMRKQVVVVDAVRDNPEDIVEALTGCFAGSGGLPELGLGTAEADVVLSAWRLHLTLWTNAKRIRGKADRLYTLSIMLVIFTALASVLRGASKDEEEHPDLLTQALKLAIVVLPLLSGVL